MTDPYLLLRDTNESQRLNDQHDLWLRQCGYAIHPRLEAGLPKDARIAEIATGTGVWAREMASKFPSARIDAFDISSEQFPTPGDHPANIQFHVHSVLEPFPADMLGKFDFVHVRALVAAMESAAWETAVQQLTRLLKPGGTVQWVEADFNKLLVLRSHDAETGTFAESLRTLVDEFNVVLARRDLDGALRLPTIFAANGLEAVQVDAISTDRVPSDRPLTTANLVIAMLGSLRAADPNNPAHLARAKAIQADIAAGAYIRANLFITMGKRIAS